MQGRLQPQVSITPRKTFGAHEAFLAKQNTKQLSEFPQSFTSLNKKREFQDRAALLQNDLRQARLTPQNTSFYTFEDSSTVKPNENTIIRNPTLIFNYGRQATQNLNRSQMVQPMNLSKIEFNMKDDESILTSVRDFQYISPRNPRNLIHQQKQVIQSRPTQQEKYTMKEVSDFSLRASLVINEIMKSESISQIGDISDIRTEGKHYEILPHLFSISQSYKLPQIIKKEISDQLSSEGSYVDYGFLEGESVAYFSFGKNLYIWGFPQYEADAMIKQQAVPLPQKFQFDQMVTAVTLATVLPGMILKDTDKILIVATTTDIKIYGFSKNIRENKVELTDTQISISTDQNIVSSILQFKKNGRIFYGGTSGHVNELKYDDTAQLNILNLLQGERRKLKKNDHQNESLIAKLIPSFFKYTQNKNITDIKLDEVRNVLYSISMSVEEDTKDEIIIEVFDLGVLSNKFSKITTIRQVDIVKQMLEFKQQETKNMKSSDFKRLSKEYPIVFVESISINQSSDYHLMLVTQNGFRIYIQFELEDAIEPQVEDFKEPFVNTDIIMAKKFSQNWQIADIMHLPDQNSFAENQLFLENVTPFYGGKIRSVAQNIMLEGQQIHYNSADGIITFLQKGISGGEPGGSEWSDNIIVLNQIAKNESSIAYRKQMREANIDHQQVIPLIEMFSQVRIPFDQQIIRNVATPGLPKENQLEYINENILDMMSSNSMINQEIAKLVSLNRTYKDSRGQQGTSLYEIQQLSLFEKQMYINGSQMTVLTDSRIIQLQQIRPIDTLVMLLNTMIDPRMQGQQTELFEDLIDMYTCRQTCQMLLQIIIDKDAFYSFSRKLEHALLNSRRKNSVQTIPQTTSKVSMMFRGSKRASKIHAQFQQEVKEQVIFRKVSTDAVSANLNNIKQKMAAWNLLNKYGDIILNLREHFDISDEAIEGMPQNIQDFSIKHFCLYQYLQRVLRPLWNLKVGYKLPSQQDQFYKLTFDSLNVPLKKLVELQEFIRENEPYLYGEQYSPKNSEKFFLNNDLYQTATPVYMLKSNQKSKLELMEKNSIKNITHMLTRCIEAIDLLQILTNNFENKFFSEVQNHIQDKNIVQSFCDMSFKDLLTLDNNTAIRRFLEASVQVESQSAEETQSLMRKKYAFINKVCSSFFSEDENIAFIGVNLLQAAKKEKNLEKREDLLRQAVTHLASQPLSIDMNQVPVLLVENGNYTSLADLTLRKIKALDCLSLEQRDRFMSKDEYQAAREQCYSIILSLFAAIDQSISKETSPQADPKNQDYIDYFLSKLNAIQNDNLKVHLRDKIMKRIELYNDIFVLTTLFDYLISRPKNQINIDALPHINDKTIYQLIFNSLSAKQISRPKFESIVKILMKKNQVEKLCTLTNQACENFYTIVSNQDGSLDPLTLKDKLNLVYTCNALIETQRQELSSELFAQYQSRLKELDETISSHINIIINIDELIATLTKSIACTKDQSKIGIWNQQVQELTSLRQTLELKLLPSEQLMKELQRQRHCHASESIIRMLIKRDPLMRYDQQNFKEAEKEIKLLVDFIQEHCNQHISDKLGSKVHIVKENKELLQIYLSRWQSALNSKYKNVKFEDSIDSLYNQMPLNNTKFEMFSFAFKNLLKQISIEDIFQLFMQNNKVFNLKWDHKIVGSDQELYYIIEFIGFTRGLIQANKEVFGINHQVPIIQKFGSQTDEYILQKQIKSFGVRIYHNKLLQLENKICSDSYSIQLPKNYTNLVQTVHNLVQDFAKMLQQHGENPDQQFNQSVMSNRQIPSFLNQSYRELQLPSQQNSINADAAVVENQSSIYSNISEPVAFKIDRREQDEESDDQ